MSLMIKGGRVLDPATDTDKIADIYIEHIVLDLLAKRVSV